jgi:hypothetical protein
VAAIVQVLAALVSSGANYSVKLGKLHSLFSLFELIPIKSLHFSMSSPVSKCLRPCNRPATAKVVPGPNQGQYKNAATMDACLEWEINGILQSCRETIREMAIDYWVSQWPGALPPPK